MILVIPWRQVSVEYFLSDMSIKLSFGVIIYWSAREGLQVLTIAQ